MLARKILSKINPRFKKSPILKERDLNAMKSDLNDLGTDDQFKKSFYSQDGEDAVLAAFYEEKPEYKGFYVDIGALHPYRFSNTQYFYEKGWRGINIDATPNSMAKFNQARPDDINVEAGISKDKKTLLYYCFKEPALNSFDKKLSEERERSGWGLIEKKKIRTMSINDFLNKYLPENKKIDFMNIDIEGLDFEVLKSLDWSKYWPDFILIEDLEMVSRNIVDYGGRDIYKFLKSKSYIIVAKTMRTLIFKNK